MYNTWNKTEHSTVFHGRHCAEIAKRVITVLANDIVTSLVHALVHVACQAVDALLRRGPASRKTENHKAGWQGNMKATMHDEIRAACATGRTTNRMPTSWRQNTFCVKPHMLCTKITQYSVSTKLTTCSVVLSTNNIAKTSITIWHVST